MTTESPSAADQPRPDNELNKSNEPGSQSSSGMSNQLDDALVEAHERSKQRRGEPMDVTPEAFGSANNPQDRADSPIGRNPEATTGPVTD